VGLASAAAVQIMATRLSVVRLLFDSWETGHDQGHIGSIGDRVDCGASICGNDERARIRPQRWNLCRAAYENDPRQFTGKQLVNKPERQPLYGARWDRESLSDVQFPEAVAALYSAVVSVLSDLSNIQCAAFAGL